MKKFRQFASDNYAGICPEAWNALAEANSGHSSSYGNDPWTGKARRLIRDLFETDCEVFFVFNGTAANALSLATLTRSYQSILCHEMAHVESDECGAPEFFSHGSKVILLPGAMGKITPEAVEKTAKRRGDVHFPKAGAVSVTQATELGTVYTPAELKEIGRVTRRLNLGFHMDGARFANAAVSLRVAPRDISSAAGVQVLSFGGTKNGMAMGETVVFFDKNLAAEFQYRRKQAAQLCSKMRFLAAAWVGMLSDGIWLKHAAHANAMARRLEQLLKTVPGVRLLFPCQANAVFVELPVSVIKRLWKKGWMFYTFIGEGGCRLMCAWDTTVGDIESFVSDLRPLMRQASVAANGAAPPSSYGGRSSRSISK